MARRVVFLIALLLAGPAGAAAQPVNGLYVSGAGGINLRAPQTVQPQRGPDLPNLNDKTPGEPGAAASGSVGYGFGNGLRIELQGNRQR